MRCTVDNLFKVRTRKKISQVNLATKIGVSQETVSAYESGKSFPSVATLMKLCDIFDVSADFLLDRTSVEAPVEKLIVGNLDSKELELISAYRELDPSKRERAIGVILGMKD